MKGHPININKAMDAAVAAARKSGKLLKENLGKTNHVEFKGEIDLVTEMDKNSETIIIESLLSAFPDYGILSEEGEELNASSPTRWIIDPLDGTTNYAHAYPVFSVSIALEDNGNIIFGLVYDPVHDELFSAEKGKGAFLNAAPIHVSTTPQLDKSLLATGFPYDIRSSEKNNLNHFCRFALKAQAIRRAGSAALDLCYVACGRFDGFWELKLKPWDVAAGTLIVKEAGGTVTDFSGNNFDIFSGNILASNKNIHDSMLNVLQSP